MFYRFGLFAPFQRLSQPSPFLRLRAFREASLKRGIVQRLQKPTNARTLSTGARPDPARIMSSKGLILTGCVGLGLTLSFKRTPIHCDASRGKAETPRKPVESLVDAPESAVNYYELSFGTVAGVCAGVFVKKGAKLAATVLGGIFVLLQYFHSLSFIRIDWSRIGEGFMKTVSIEDEDGTRHPPTILSLWNWLVDFVTADFQPRATFMAGFLLGMRIG